MNEEEILKECNELAKNEHHELGDCFDEEYSANAIQGLLDLYNQEKESHKIDNENYKILHDDVTALAKYMGLEEDAIIDEMYETFDKEKEKNKKLEEEKEKFIENHTKVINDEVKRAEWSYNQKKFYEKVIDLMTFDIVGSNVFEYEDTGKDMSIEDNIRGYYFKKARGDEDERDNT